MNCINLCNNPLNTNETFYDHPPGCSLSSCSKFPLPEYYYVNLLMNWTDAQDYCRVHYTDLATLESMDDINRLKADFSYNLSWVGLSRDPNSRRWSATVEANTTGFHAWAETEPNHIGGNENCVLMSTNRQWRDYSCDRVRTFVCYTGKKTFELSDFICLKLRAS